MPQLTLELVAKLGYNICVPLHKGEDEVLGFINVALFREDLVIYFVFALPSCYE